MSKQEVSTEEFCQSILELSPEDRHERLKELGGNELFCDVIRVQPGFFQEFMWFEKRAELESCLIEAVSVAGMQAIVGSATEDMGPTSLTKLLDQWSEGDEFWRFEATPGDKGYALVRGGRILAYCIIEITCV